MIYVKDSRRALTLRLARQPLAAPLVDGLETLQRVAGRRVPAVRVRRKHKARWVAAALRAMASTTGIPPPNGRENEALCGERLPPERPANRSSRIPPAGRSSPTETPNSRTTYISANCRAGGGRSVVVCGRIDQPHCSPPFSASSISQPCCENPCRYTTTRPPRIRGEPRSSGTRDRAGSQLDGACCCSPSRGALGRFASWASALARGCRNLLPTSLSV